MVSNILSSSAAAAGASTAFPLPGGILEHTIFVKVSAAASVIIEASHNGTDWANADEASYPKSATGNFIAYLSSVPYVRVSWTGNTGTISASLSSM